MDDQREIDICVEIAVLEFSTYQYIYLQLKQNEWVGNFALGASYISLPWWAGQALFGTDAAKWICVSAIDVTQLSVAVTKKPKWSYRDNDVLRIDLPGNDLEFTKEGGRLMLTATEDNDVDFTPRTYRIEVVYDPAHKKVNVIGGGSTNGVTWIHFNI
ncbi:hypothetical protein F2Q70_00034820 [Brassica cretica]|uniref:Uncharacterized protein n=1 Tax=Brassica cretica TaxID=69181 RepID=A0A8S9K077_BRACR|nr:hypothetical protein F2Q70_00034820 [Brassica cretica]